MKRMMTIMVSLVAVAAVHAEPILWDLNSGRAADVDATVADFYAAGVTENITGGTVSVVQGQAAGSMTNNGVTLSYATAEVATSAYAYTPALPADGSAITVDYVYMSYGDPVDFQIGGLSSKLSANTEYGFYLWGYGDSADQNSTFIFDGVTNTVAAVADPQAVGASELMVKYAFTTGDTVSDTLDFTWSRTGGQRFAAINGFAIAAVPEPGTFGLFAVFGGAVLFIRRKFR